MFQFKETNVASLITWSSTIYEFLFVTRIQKCKIT